MNWIIRLPTKSRNTWKIGYWGSLYVEGKLKRRIGGNIKNWDAGKIISGRLFRESRLAGNGLGIAGDPRGGMYFEFGLAPCSWEFFG